MNERAPLTARVNLLKTTREALLERLRAEGVDARPTPLSPLGLFLETRQNAFSLPSFREGLFELQDEGSQLLGCSSTRRPPGWSTPARAPAARRSSSRHR